MFEASADSWWRLTLDLGSAKLLVWVASVGRPAELTRDAHLFFADRYQRLGQVLRAQHRIARAERLEQKAQEQSRGSGLAGSTVYGGAGDASAAALCCHERRESPPGGRPGRRRVTLVPPIEGAARETRLVNKRLHPTAAAAGSW